jgi:hypothetical protein
MLVVLVVSPTLQGFISAVVAAILSWIVGYPLAKWIYTRIFGPDNHAS